MMGTTDYTARHVQVPDRLRAVKRRTPAFVKQAARSTLRRVGESTAQARTLPNFLVIGTKRGGTTSLINWLLSHPEVMPLFPAAQQIKSPHYFDINYWRGEPGTAHTSPRSGPSTGWRPDRAPTGGRRGEPLLHVPPGGAGRGSPTRLPTSRVIVLLRDPVRRAYSNYWERRGSKAEDLATFEEAIAAEPRRLAAERRPSGWPTRTTTQPTMTGTATWPGAATSSSSRAGSARFDRKQLLVLEVRGPLRRARRDQRPGTTVPRPDGRRDRPAGPPQQAAGATDAAETRERLTAYYEPHNRELSQALGADMGWGELALAAGAWHPARWSWDSLGIAGVDCSCCFLGVKPTDGRRLCTPTRRRPSARAPDVCTVTDKSLAEISGAVATPDGLGVANDKGATVADIDDTCRPPGPTTC